MATSGMSHGMTDKAQLSNSSIPYCVCNFLSIQRFRHVSATCRRLAFHHTAVLNERSVPRSHTLTEAAMIFT